MAKIDFSGLNRDDSYDLQWLVRFNNYEGQLGNDTGNVIDSIFAKRYFVRFTGTQLTYDEGLDAPVSGKLSSIYVGKLSKPYDGDFFVYHKPIASITGLKITAAQWAAAASTATLADDLKLMTHSLQGDDRLISRSHGTALIHGYSGNDRIENYGSGSARLHGGAGNDAIHNSGTGFARIYGDAGNDDLESSGNKGILFGGTGNDTLTATYGGEASLIGGAGHDVLEGGLQKDRLIGDAGNDTIEGSFGHDTISGGDGVDRLSGEFGNDILSGGRGHDLLVGGDGSDRLDGGDGNDRLFGDALRDDEYTSGRDTLYGGNGNDTLSGGNGNDVLHGGAGLDLIIGGDGFDVMTGDDGRDRFVIQHHLDSGNSSSTRDKILDFNAVAGETIDLSRIDADFMSPAQEVFVLLTGYGAAFTNTAGELRRVVEGSSVIIEGDVTGDGVADFQIEIVGVTSVPDTAIIL